ncbi:MAG: hypothetical protein LH614_08075 [Pyrinomonadaceae bacterium]|nr:hypothetical protein [Pyrinomonadaceae bacterium]
MKLKNIFRLHNLLSALLAAFALAFSGGVMQPFAHGDEDHGEAKPKTETTDKGGVSHTTRVGDLEVMLKHERLIPDAGNMARFFVTLYKTNEAFADVAPAIEIEAANGVVTQATIEKSDAAGSFTVKLPALAEGTYLIRAKLTHGGETDTATFSGIEIARQSVANASGSSWTQTALMIMLFLVALAFFGGLAYFARRVFSNKPIREDAVSA